MMDKFEDNLDTSRLGEIRKRLGKSLPNDWTLTTLGETFKWGSGGTPKRTDTRFYGGVIPWLIIGDLNDGIVNDSETTITEAGLRESSTKWVEPGSILLAMYGSIGKLGIAGRRLTTNQAIAFTKPDSVDAKYLFYYLMFTRGDLASLGKGATQKNISQTVIKAFPFVLAPLDQQKCIVAEIEKQFSRLDEAVANLKRVKANLKRYKAAVLKAAVEGRLVETEAEIARRESRNYETGEQLLQRILETRRSQWKGKGKYKEPAAPDTADLPELPGGWVWATIGQTSECLDSMRVPVNKKERLTRTGNVPYYGANGRVGFIDDYIYDEPLVLVVEDETFTGRELPFSYKISGKTWVNNHAHVLRPTDMVTLDYLNYALSYYPFTARTTGTTGRKKLTQIALVTAPLGIPPLPEQLRIIAEIDRRVSLIRETEAQIETNLKRSERMRQSILASAFAGQILDDRQQTRTTALRGLICHDHVP